MLWLAVLFYDVYYFRGKWTFVLFCFRVCLEARVPLGEMAPQELGYNNVSCTCFPERWEIFQPYCTVYPFEFFLKWDETVVDSSFLTCRVAETFDCPDAYQLSSPEEALFSSKFYSRVQVYYSAPSEENQVYLSWSVEFTKKEQCQKWNRNLTPLTFTIKIIHFQIECGDNNASLDKLSGVIVFCCCLHFGRKL